METFDAYLYMLKIIYMYMYIHVCDWIWENPDSIKIEILLYLASIMSEV